MELLAQRPEDFSFLQAVRLLAQHYLVQNGQGDFFTDFLRVRADLNLAFPESDLSNLEYLFDALPSEAEAVAPSSPSKVRLTASFFGLYGSSSPLPTFYTEELLEEQSDDESVQRDFLDIVGQTLYSLLLSEQFRHRLMDKVVSLNRYEPIDRLLCLAGLGHPELRAQFEEPGALVRVAGLLGLFPRSAAGLRALLRDQFSTQVEISQCVPDAPSIAEDQRCHLGQSNCNLGQNARLGSVAADCLGRIGLKFSALELDEFQPLCPGGASYEKVKKLLNFYCPDPLLFDLTLELKAGRAQAPRLGENCRLGMGLWLGCPAPDKTPEAFFPAYGC